MDWIHCNSCFLIPSASRGNKFHLTNCGHIYCEQCLTTGGTKKCKVCNTCNFNTVILQSQAKKYRAAKEEIHKQSETIKKQKQEIKELKEKLSLQGRKHISPISVGNTRNNVEMSSSSNPLLSQKMPMTPTKTFGNKQSSPNFWVTPNRPAVHSSSPSNEASPLVDLSPISSPVTALGFQLPEMYRFQHGNLRNHPKTSPGSSTATLLNKLRLMPH